MFLIHKVEHGQAIKTYIHNEKRAGWFENVMNACEEKERAMVAKVNVELEHEIWMSRGI